MKPSAYFKPFAAEDLKDNVTFTKAADGKRLRDFTVKFDDVFNTVYIYPTVTQQFSRNTTYERMKLDIRVIDGKLYYRSASGHRLAKVANIMGIPVRPLGPPTYEMVYVGDRNPLKEISPDLLNQILVAMEEGLNAEAAAQREFYKGWRNPD